MTRIEKMDRDVAWILAEIRRQNSTDGKLNSSGYFEFEEGPEVPTLSLQSTIVVGHLQRADVLKVIKETTRQAFVKHEYGSDLMTVDDGIEIEINVVKFEELEAALKRRILASNPQKIPITLSNLYGVFRSDSEDRKYEIRGKRKEILFLVASKGPIRAETIREELNFDYSNSKLSGEIKEINKKFQTDIDVVSPIIIHSTSSGYSLNKNIFDTEIQ